MGKRTSTKRLSTVSQSASGSIDVKARKRIEQLYELTDEIISAYNEINDKYVNQIYRKYENMKELNRQLQRQLTSHHCAGCKCTDRLHDEDGSDNSVEQNGGRPRSSTRTKKTNPFIISDVEETQSFEVNDSRFDQTMSEDDDPDKVSMESHQSDRKTTNDIDDQDKEDDVANLPIPLHNVIQRKAKNSKPEKTYLLHIPRYPDLCKFLRDKARSSFDQRPTEDQVRPLIAKHMSEQLALDKKIRQRVRDELREIHRSYMRTFMIDPHGTHKAGPKSQLLAAKQSPT